MESITNQTNLPPGWRTSYFFEKGEEEMLYPSLSTYRQRNGEGYRFIHPVSRLYGELPSNITGALVWVEGKTECRLGVVLAVAGHPTRTKLIAAGPGWYALATHRQVWFPGPTPLRCWAQHVFTRAGLPVAAK